MGDVRYESVTVSSTAIGMTVTAGNGFIPQVAEITVENAALRYRTDGTDPTATEGHEVADGGKIVLLNQGEVKLFRAIRRDGADATIRCSQGVDYVP
jgi:hypothetical protein